MSLKRARFLLMLLAALCLLSLSVACGSGEDDEDEDEGGDTPTTTTATKYAPTGNEGTITGTVNFSGGAPEEKRISMDQDPVCSSNNPNAVAEDIVVKDGKLQNVFVYVKDGKLTDGNRPVSGFAFDTPADAKVLDQHGCHYVPHVLGIQTGQKLTIKNSDPTAHNVNLGGQNNPKFNQSQPPSSPPLEKSFAQPETLIPVKCNQHPWMKSYIGVLKHPFFAVSGDGGSFEIKGLPPGTYTLEAWHEKYKPQTMQVTIGSKESKTADFTFAAASAATELEGGSLRILPALDVPMLGGH